MKAHKFSKKRFYFESIASSHHLFIYLQRNFAIGAWCSWLAFLHGVQAVARSSRAAPTIKRSTVKC